MLFRPSIYDVVNIHSIIFLPSKFIEKNIESTSVIVTVGYHKHLLVGFSC